MELEDPCKKKLMESLSLRVLKLVLSNLLSKECANDIYWVVITANLEVSLKAETTASVTENKVVACMLKVQTSIGPSRVRIRSCKVCSQCKKAVAPSSLNSRIINRPFKFGG